MSKCRDCELILREYTELTKEIQEVVSGTRFIIEDIFHPSVEQIEDMLVKNNITSYTDRAYRCDNEDHVRLSVIKGYK
jgi:hypothetical protein